MEARWDVAMAALASYLIVSFLAVVGLVPALVAGIGILLVRPLLAVSVGPGGFLLRRCGGATKEAGLLKHEPEVSRPQDQVDEAKSLEEETTEPGQHPSPNGKGSAPPTPRASPQRC